MRKYPPDPGHGVFDLLEALDRLKDVTVPAATAPADKATFDRMVRESMDRMHRRKVIAEG
jgi:hypothetical protein